ncbi:MAG TPA: efflux RND transporter periplasmic adaptor subunit [Phycisphaerae bacterium]|nr:efflux RND transporter periplasmic adaptor subunit [Phycisphaerae bacterium]
MGNHFITPKDRLSAPDGTGAASPRSRRLLRWGCAAGGCFAIVIAVAALGGCKRSEAEGRTPSAADAGVPVSVAEVQQRDVPVQLRAIGTVEAYRIVSIKSQVQGELTEICFNEGQYVNQGDVLFKIDARPYEVALRLAEATLAKDSALAKDAEAEAVWMKDLVGSEAAAQREGEKARAAADAAWAQVDADKAAVDNAKLDLEWCTIKAPFEGYTGSLMVHRGAILKSRETELISLNQVRPVYVTFSVPENQLGDIKANSAIGSLEVDATFPGEEEPPIRGTLSFLDNQADRTTGMIRLKGTFANEDKRLWPGQFVNVALTLAQEHGAVLVPTQAIQTGQKGQYVFVVKEDQTVEMRTVTPGREVDGWTVVGGGLEAGQTVVTDGQLRLVPGARIQQKNVPPASTQSATTKASS